MDLSSLYSDPEDDYDDPKRFAQSLGLIDDYPSEPNQQLNYLDDNFGTFTRKLPIDQPSGSIVSGGREDLYHKYSQMLGQKPESESILEDYIGRRPSREQFGNSLGRKLLAGLTGFSTGMLGGGPMKAFQATTGILNQPYDQAIQDYNSEGRYVYDYAKLKESSRQRELQGILTQIRQQEIERANRAREAGVGELRNIQQQRADEYARGRQAQEEGRSEDRKFRGSQLEETRRHNRAMESLGGQREDRLKNPPTKFGSTMHTPTRTEIQRNLTDKIITGDAGVKGLFGTTENGKPAPIWAIEGREPTPLEVSRYHQIMMDLERGNLPSIDQLGFGR